ncbi:uncharacterized protein BXZ73DRAFT_106170 [Epithele typhae]|uniref:uncharacterized protein n=1 Tax=Epithele typhae TaxID=378194 RepID=UPI002008E710|nr:uncharacterized protein BXZ73DRAFT_106170 [Epithele typhae]KAH9915441.1 hypothetical protein BXZ73DRAFT_106170 [Epithele typhae]
MVKFPSLSQTARVCNAWGESDTATGFHHTRSPGGRWFREWDQAHIAEVQSCDQAALGASGRTHGKHPAPVEPLEGEPHPAPAAQPMHQNSESLSEVDPTKPRARKGLLNGARPPAPGQLILKPGQKSVAEGTAMDANSFRLYSVVATAALYVAEALVNVLGWAEEIGHELLELSTDLLRFAPIPGLEEAARTLLGIWDALQMVDINRLACLCLTERCATVLISIREEISDAGDDVSIELRPPLNRLVESYKEVHRFLFKQARRPFIKRYLQRDEIARSLSGCHNSITDALTMFNTSIQIRILKQTAIWKTLQHPNPLPEAWQYLKGLSSLDGVDLLKMIHEIAKGVLHGDLKAANVLVNDRHHCVIPDFGQSEMKTEAYGVSGLPLPHGTLRWQAPELMAGLSGLTQAVDLYAFAITCVELLTKGALPWSMADDDALLLLRVWSSQLSEILGLCWHRDWGLRPSFEKVDKQVQQLRSVYGLDLKESPAPRPTELEHLKTRKSPNMHPIPLPLLPPDTTASFVEVGSAPSTDVSFMTATEMSSEMLRDGHGERVDQDPSRSSSRASSSLHDSQFERIEYPRHLSPPPPDELAQNVRDERRYRMLLQHEFHPSLTLLLWSPGQIAIGAAGYRCEATGGEFITLFNAFEPMKTSGGLARDIPSLYGYGHVNLGSQRQDKRDVAQRGMDLIQSWLTSTRTRAGEAKYSRRYATPLRAARWAQGCASKWLKANVDDILKLYGAEHHISQEDLHFVIGTLEAQDYALFVSHDHPDSQVEFNVFSAMRTGQPWGEFRSSSDLTASFLGGDPHYDDEPQVTHQYTPKI